MAAHLSPECADLIEFQCGVLARWQAADDPRDLSSMTAMLRAERWQTLYRGVYAAYTGRPSRDSVLWAAVRRCGPEAMLSHFTAAELDGFADLQRDVVHVTIPDQSRVRLSRQDHRAGLPRIVVHRSARAVETRHPARTPPRTRIDETVLDLADLAQTFDGAFGWLSTACGRRLVTPDQLRAAAERRAKMRWRADVLVATAEIADGVQSNLERGYVRNVERRHQLPRAKRQARVRQGGRSAYLDNQYEEFGLAVELDGLAAHPAETRWLDMRRDSAMAAAGIVTLRYSWADIAARPCQVAREIGLVLRQRGWSGTPRSCGPACRARIP
jgi:very-short-patch-repair endonuclease